MVAFDMAVKLRGRDVAINALHPASMMPAKLMTGRFATRSTVEEGVRIGVGAAYPPTAPSKSFKSAWRSRCMAASMLRSMSCSRSDRDFVAT